MKPLSTTLLKPNQIQELKEEKQTLEWTVSSDNPGRTKVNKPQMVHSKIKQIDRHLDAFAPAALPGDEQDKLAKVERELREKFTQGMPSYEEMRKNPPGMVAQHMRWEKANKKDIFAWKNVVRQLEPDNDDPDLANIERYRPAGASERVRLDAQIPGKMAYTHVPQGNWDAAFEGKKPENTALAQAERVHEEKRGRRVWTEEQKADARNRLAAARAKKKHNIELRQAEQAATV